MATEWQKWQQEHILLLFEVLAQIIVIVKVWHNRSCVCKKSVCVSQISVPCFSSQLSAGHTCLGVVISALLASQTPVYIPHTRHGWPTRLTPDTGGRHTLQTTRAADTPHTRYGLLKRLTPDTGGRHSSHPTRVADTPHA